MTVASPHLGDKVFRERAHGIKAGVVCGGKEILKRRQHPLAELRLPYGREPPVGAKALDEALDGGKGKDLLDLGTAALLRVERDKRPPPVIGERDIRVVDERREVVGRRAAYPGSR